MVNTGEIDDESREWMFDAEPPEVASWWPLIWSLDFSKGAGKGGCELGGASWLRGCECVAAGECGFVARCAERIRGYICETVIEGEGEALLMPWQILGRSTL